MSKRQGPPKHQNRFTWKANAGRKINETELGGKLKPLSDITGVCPRCKEQIDWKRRYGKYKPLSEPAKCQRCSKRAVRQAYHNLCPGCAKEQNVCAKCCCHVGRIVGRDSAELEAEQKALEEAIKNARERDRRTLLRAMNKGTSKSSAKPANTEENKVGDLFPSSTLEEYAAKSREHNRNLKGHNNLEHVGEEEVGGDDDEAEEDEDVHDDDGGDEPKEDEDVHDDDDDDDAEGEDADEDDEAGGGEDSLKRETMVKVDK